MKGDFEKKFYEITEQLSSHGFKVDRFDRVRDFKKTIVAIPTSGKTGEGIPELFAMMIGLANQFMMDKLETSNI